MLPAHTLGDPCISPLCFGQKSLPHDFVGFIICAIFKSLMFSLQKFTFSLDPLTVLGVIIAHIVIWKALIVVQAKRKMAILIPIVLIFVAELGRVGKVLRHLYA